ncbi:MAG: hypothetical protein ACM31D_04615 [Bacteroidota bacterium]
MARTPQPSTMPTEAPVLPAIGGSRTLEDMELIAHGKLDAFPAKAAADPGPAPEAQAATPSQTQE